jgi:hypothetical protein
MSYYGVLGPVYLHTTSPLCRWLHEDDARRKHGRTNPNDTGFFEEDHGATPAPRTHKETVAQGKDAEDFTGVKKSVNHPKKLHGVAGWCPLETLPFFDLVWDVCPDFMHILKNLFERYFGTLLDGERIPKDSKHHKAPRKGDAEFAKKKREFDAETVRFDEACARAKKCTLTQRNKEQVDIRCKKLSQDKSTGIPKSLVPFSTMPGHSKQKSATWVKVLRFYVPYLLYGVGDKKVREALLLLTEALRNILDATCDFDPDDEETSAEEAKKCAELKKKIVGALVEIEARLPASELSIFFHEIVHIADFLYRWNNVRNYWCFVTERFVGYVKGFVKNRHLALENLVHDTQSLCCLHTRLRIA